MTSASTAPARLVEVIRRQILSGRIRPDSWIREVDWARRMAVSRTPIREALLELCREGLLRKVPHRGFWCPPLLWADVKEVYPVLVSLEQLAIGSIPPASRQQLCVRLRGLNEQLRGASLRQRLTLDQAFHSTLVAAARNPVLQEVHGELMARLARYESAFWRHTTHSGESALQHARILRHLGRGDVAAASAGIAVHWREGAERVCRLLAAGAV